jgi:ribosomal protein S19
MNKREKVIKKLSRNGLIYPQDLLNTMQFYDKKDYKKAFPQIKLHKDCVYVEDYLFHINIQMLSDGTYYCELNDATESDEMNTTVRTRDRDSAIYFMIINSTIVKYKQI